MEVEGTLTAAALLACMTAVVLSCASCKKLFKKKVKSNRNNDEEHKVVNVAEEEKAENGICNPAYDITTIQENSNGQHSKHGCKSEQDESSREKADGSSVIGMLEQDSDSLKIENECATRRTPINISLNGDSEEHEKNETNEETETSSPHTNQRLNSSNSVESESSIHPHKFSESIKSADIANLTFALNHKIKEPIEEEIDATTSSLVTSEQKIDEIKTDLSRFNDVVFQGGWRRDVKLKDLLEMNLIDEKVADEVLIRWKEPTDNPDSTEPTEFIHDKLKPFLIGESPVAGILFSETGETKSIFSSAKHGLLRRGTAISLLEAQAATGNIIDPVSGRKMSVSEGFQLGLLDKVYETVVLRAERAVTGYKSRVTDEVMSLGQAINRGLVVESQGIRLLEAQLATGGIIDHKSNIRVPIEVATYRGLLDQKLAQKLSEFCKDIADEHRAADLKMFFDPNTEENVTYQELMRRSVIDESTGMRLYPLEKIGRKKLNHSGFSGLSSLSSSRTSSRDSIPAAIATEK